MVLKSLVRERTESGHNHPSPLSTHGLLVIDKPAGWSSHDVVAKLRKILGVRKVGHAGTLDPDATGLLPVCVGQATRIVEYLIEIPKAYRLRMKLGEETDTEDASGQVTKRHDLKGLNEEQVRSVVLGFQGDIQQVPPMFSALKKNGRRLYEYARDGEEVTRRSRSVTIYEIGDLHCDIPEISFYVRCSRGTYIRSLCRDIGRKLGVGGHLADLRRTECATFTEKDAHTLSEIDGMGREKALSLLVTMDAPLRHFTPVEVHSDRAYKICRGQDISEEDLSREPGRLHPGDLLRIYSENGTFLAIGMAGQSSSDTLIVSPKKVFCDRIKN